MDLADKQYVERCRDGHPEEFGLLVDRYQKPLFAFLASRVRNLHEAEEAAQESFVRAFVSLSKLRKPELFYSWLLGIAERVAREQFRFEARHRQEPDALTPLMTNAEDHTVDSPVEEAIAALPENHRQVILLRYYEGLSCQDMAARLKIPLGTVTKTLSRAYGLLRQELKARERAE